MVGVSTGNASTLKAPPPLAEKYRNSKNEIIFGDSRNSWAAAAVDFRDVEGRMGRFEEEVGIRSPRRVEHLGVGILAHSPEEHIRLVPNCSSFCGNYRISVVELDLLLFAPCRDVVALRGTYSRRIETATMPICFDQ